MILSEFLSELPVLVRFVLVLVLQLIPETRATFSCTSLEIYSLYVTMGVLSLQFARAKNISGERSHESLKPQAAQNFVTNKNYS